jgi:patatin-like phospholipase/acyl hydrolase
MPRTFRILSLDGGGVKGVFTAAFLTEIERMSGMSVADHFDLIAGTSTGGIIALGLGVGISASALLDFYLSNGNLIFPSVGIGVRFWRNLRWAVCGKHHSEQLKTALETAFGDKKVTDSRTRLVIPAFNATNGRATVFKTAHCDDLKQDYLERCVDVALATSAAPTFLPGHTFADGRSYLDGGVWANNPMLVGILEAVTKLQCPAADIDVLSIGTTEEAFHIDHGLRRRGGYLKWRSRLISLYMQAQTDSIINQSTLLLRVAPYRVSPTVVPSRFRMDDARQMSELKALGLDCARREETVISARFLNGAAARFVPNHR